MFVTFVLSVCSILMIGVYYFILSRNKHFSKNLYFKRIGVICSRCSNLIIDSNQALRQHFFDRKDNTDIHLTECVSCHRNSRLKLLIGLTTLKDKFDRWVLTKKSEKILILCIFIPFPFIIASMFIGNKTFSSVTSIVNSSVLITYWLIMIYRVYLCRKPLPEK